MHDSMQQVIDYFRRLEDTIATLPLEEQEKLFRPCAIECVKKYVLDEQKRLFGECHNSLDEMYEKGGKTEYFFGEIVERGHVYEIGYPRCLCYMHEAGFANAPIHCECSRQSILYVLHELLPDQSIQVETIHTVLSGADECRFRITVE